MYVGSNPGPATSVVCTLIMRSFRRGTKDAIGPDVTSVTYREGESSANWRIQGIEPWAKFKTFMRRNVMTRAPILSAVAAALLLGLAAAGPLAAEDAATPAPSATPAPAKGEFDNSCAMGLVKGRR